MTSSPRERNDRLLLTAKYIQSQGRSRPVDRDAVIGWVITTFGVSSWAAHSYIRDIVFRGWAFWRRGHLVTPADLILPELPEDRFNVPLKASP